ncbi:ankyrin repeat domain-containing protein [Mesorhizobium marinum]|uniref:ankyrin repeat domain-containing protein n=1 Tax=Mesorhizobium marinum TaxID=3228790 RepID=UPI0034657F22
MLLSWWAAVAGEGDDAMILEAVLAGNLQQVRMLVDRSDLEVRDGQGRTGLLLATRADNVEIARLLIEAGADVNARDAIKDTPYLYAGAEGRDEILKMILATGRANLKDTNRYGGTALIPAADKGHPSTVRLLIAAGVEIDHVNNLGWTALMEAVILGDGGPVHQEIVGILVDARARQIPDRDGITPLEHARRLGFGEIAERMVSGPR